MDLLGHAITASTVANVNRAKGSKSYKPSDFMPKFDKEPQNVEEQMQIATMITEVMGGKDERKVKADPNG